MPIRQDRDHLRRIDVSGRSVWSRGLRNGVWSDINHRALTMPWSGFFAFAALIFVAFNLLFAAIYALAANPIANVKPGDFLDLFYFSIETMATVGFGDMHPQTTFGHSAASVEIFIGMSLVALYTGLCFARFSRPQARFAFAETVVVAPEDDVPTLMVRVANQRQNTISGATARVWLLRNIRTANGQELRRYVELPLLRAENPVFALSWTLFHVIGQTSALYGLTPEALAQSDARIILTLTGLDEASGNSLNARKSYDARQIQWNYRYADLFTSLPSGELMIDYSKLSDTISLET